MRVTTAITAAALTLGTVSAWAQAPGAGSPPATSTGRGPSAIAGQTPSTGSGQAPSTSAGQAKISPPPPTETYTYQPEGRRDPFLSVIGTGNESRLTSRKGEGPSGMTVAEISVSGIMQSRGSMIAMIKGPDNKTYIVHQGDKLLDGTIKTVNQQGLIVSQQVNDPLSIVKQRDVRKVLRSLEDGKE